MSASAAVKSDKSNRGFTLIEMLVVVGVLALILGMIGLEFVGVVSHTLHTRANTDAQAQSRLIMTKVTDEMHAAFPDVTDCSSFPDAKCGVPYGQLVVVQPAPKSTPGPIAQFYRVHQGALNSPVHQCADTRPCPPYDEVTILINPLVPGELDEIVAPALGGLATTTVLGLNVTGFTVTPDQTTGASDYAVEVTVSIPSSHCTGSECNYTLNNVVYVGGLGTE